MRPPLFNSEEGADLQNTVTIEPPASYRVEDVQQILGIGRNSAYSLIKQKGFPAIRVGSRIVIPSDLFHAWVQQQAVKGATFNGR